VKELAVRPVFALLAGRGRNLRGGAPAVDAGRELGSLRDALPVGNASRTGSSLTLEAACGIDQTSDGYHHGILRDVWLARMWVTRATTRFQKQGNALQP
jgi:hypothetical protein